MSKVSRKSLHEFSKSSAGSPPSSRPWSTGVWFPLIESLVSFGYATVVRRSIAEGIALKFVQEVVGVVGETNNFLVLSGNQEVRPVSPDNTEVRPASPDNKRPGQ